MSVNLGDLTRPVRWPLLGAIVLDAISALMIVVPFVAVVEIARALLGGAGTHQAWRWAWIAIGALLVRAITMFAAYTATHLAEAHLADTLRLRIVTHLARLPLGWFTRHASGRVKKAAQDDVASLHHMVAHSAVDTTTAVVVPVATLAYLLTVEWRMALVALLPLVAACVMYAVALGGSMEMFRSYDASLADINAATVEYAGGIAVVKAFGQTGKAHHRFDEVCGEFLNFFGRWMRQAGRAGTGVEVISSPPVALLLLVLTGAGLVATGTPALDVLPGIVLGLGISGPVLALSMGFQDLREAREAADRIGALLAVPPLAEAAHPRLPDGHRVGLAEVTFRYEADPEELTESSGEAGASEDAPAAVADVTLDFPPGTVTALVGLSGSGKSTLARLVPRFYDPQRGRVSVGGVAVDQVATDELYRHISFVFQEDYLLAASVRDNIALGRPEASDAEIEGAARAAQIADRIAELPNGYATVLDYDVQLSGGERQRIAIARALLVDAPVIVLDEATSFADPDSEAAIQDALSRLAVGRTVLVIAHRLHTITHADQIVVLDGGRVVERGTHDGLLARGEHYARLWAATAQEVLA
jgi:ATP-binding cassette subfamily B protein IrtA